MKDYTLQSGEISWKCTRKSCSGRIKTDQAVCAVLVTRGHNHEGKRSVASQQMVNNCSLLKSSSVFSSTSFDASD